MRLQYVPAMVAAALMVAAVLAADGSSRKASAENGLTVFNKNACVGCHAIRGTGGKVGPDLAGVGSRHKQDWIAKQLVDPKSHNPKSVMPSFAQLPKSDREDLVAYLLTLKAAAR